MQFAQIPGLSLLKNQLVSAFQKGKVAHAQLYSGRSGTAVFPMALAYASYLMCENRTAEDSCGKCANCLRIGKLVHPDIHLHFPKVSAAESKYEKVLSDALPKFRSFVQDHPFGTLEEWAVAYGQENKNMLISREDSRQMLKSVSMRSVEGGYKVLIIWCPEQMNPNAANAILKILEEPPERTIYLLVTYSYESLLATITSRTQLVAVPPSSDDEVQKYLQEKGVEPEKAAQAALLSEGKIGLALHYASVKEPVEHQPFQQWMLSCWNKDLTTLVKRSEMFAKSGKASQRSELSYASSLIRNALVHASGQSAPAQSPEEQGFVSKFSDRLGYEKLERIYFLLNTAQTHLERNSNPRITHLNLSLDIVTSLNS